MKDVKIKGGLGVRREIKKVLIIAILQIISRTGLLFALKTLSLVIPQKTLAKLPVAIINARRKAAISIGYMRYSFEYRTKKVIMLFDQNKTRPL